MHPKHQLGLIGYPLSHSFSKKHFTEKFKKEKLIDFAYELFPLENINLLPQLLEKYPNLLGFNITIPYKEQVLKYLDDVDEDALAIGAVNTVKIKDGKLTGYNTDVYGFEQSLQPLLSAHHKNALILGTGGASKAVVFVCKKLKINYTFVSRTPSQNQLNYSDLSQLVIQNNSIIVNTTPVGTYPNIENSPNIPYHYLTDKHFLYDLVYNPAESEFLKQGKARGAITKNGLEMLFLQAEKAWKLWLG